MSIKILLPGPSSVKQASMRRQPPQLTSHGQRRVSQSQPESGVAATEARDMVRKAAAMVRTVTWATEASRKVERVASTVPMV